MTLNSPYEVPHDQQRVDMDQWTLGELRALLDEAQTGGAPAEAKFSLRTLANLGQMIVSWKTPEVFGGFTGLHLFRKCPCGRTDCPDRKDSL